MAESDQLLRPGLAMRPLDIPPVLVHGVFFVSLTTTAGLIAVWAALSPRHRLLRVAGFCVFPAALWFAPAPELARDILVEMAAIAMLVSVARFVARAPYGRSYAKLPRWRFGLGSLFYAIFLSALAVASASLLAPQFAGWEPKHVVRWLLEPLALSLAIVGATYFAYGDGARVKRLSALFVGCLVGGGVWLGLVLLAPNAPGMFDLFLFDYSTWLGAIDREYVSLAPCVAGVLAAFVLMTFRGSRKAVGTTRRDPLISRLGSRARSALRMAIVAAVTLPWFYMYYELVRPIAAPKADIPSPNGYEELVALGQQLNVPGISEARGDELLGQTRRCLAMPSWVNVNYSAYSGTVEASQFQAQRELARKLAAAGDAEQLSGDVSAGLWNYLDVLTLADRSQRGGIAIHALVGSAIEGIAIESLTSVAPDLSSDQCRGAVVELLDYDDGREPIEEILHRDEVFSHLCYGWVTRWQWAVETISGSRGTMAYFKPTMREVRKRYQARLRAAACDLAIQAFWREQDQFPEALDALVPKYLPRVPLDPYDGQPVKFVKEADRYSVSTQGGGTSGTGAEGPFVIARRDEEP